MIIAPVKRFNNGYFQIYIKSVRLSLLFRQPDALIQSYCSGRKTLIIFKKITKIKTVTQVGIEPTPSHSQGGDVAQRITEAPNRTL